MKEATGSASRAAARAPARRHKASEERRAEIAAATMAILAEEGLHAWTTSALARRVGVSEACLFRHYPAKEDILADAVGRAADELRRRIEAYRPSGDAWQGARGLVLTLLGFVEQTGGAPLVVLSGHAAPVSRGLQ